MLALPSDPSRQRKGDWTMSGSFTFRLEHADGTPATLETVVPDWREGRQYACPCHAAAR
jgi:hypothetical protein